MSKKRSNKSKLDIQKLFCIASFVFIATCILWYGGRFTYFYLKNEEVLKETDTSNTNTTFSEQIKSNNYETSNLKKINDKYYFYGQESSNYVSYSNLMWRIVRINEDNSITLISDDVMGTLAYGDINNTYQESNLVSWLNSDNGKFSKLLNNKEKYLSSTSICIDNIDDINNMTCTNKDEENYVGLLSIEDYINTGGNNSFINNGRYIYLANRNSENEIWYVTNEGKLNTSLGGDILGIKPTITIASNTSLLGGIGTIDDPYKFEEENGLIGSYVSLDNDMWRIYEKNDNIIKLVLQDTLKENDTNFRYRYSNNTYYHNDTIYGSLAYYLNTTYYNSLSYKNLIIENTYTNGLYGITNNYNYADISSKTIETKVSIPSLDDIILNDNLNEYFTNTGKFENQEAVYYHKAEGMNSPKIVTSEANVVPCISINMDNLNVGTGSIDDPYRME